MIYGILVLWKRFSNSYMKNELMPEIENYCVKHGIYSQVAYDNYQKNKFAENSLYLYHGYAESDIPTGIEYEVIARMGKYGVIQPDSVLKCHSKVLSFFTQYPVQPFYQADSGYHGLSLVQFEQEIPPMIYELEEVTQKEPLDWTTQICLGSKEGIQRMINKDMALRELSKIFRDFDIKNKNDLYSICYSFDMNDNSYMDDSQMVYGIVHKIREEENKSKLYQVIEEQIIKKYNLNQKETEEIIDKSLDNFWQKNLYL